MANFPIPVKSLTWALAAIVLATVACTQAEGPPHTHFDAPPHAHTASVPHLHSWHRLVDKMTPSVIPISIDGYEGLNLATGFAVADDLVMTAAHVNGDEDTVTLLVSGGLVKAPGDLPGRGTRYKAGAG